MGSHDLRGCPRTARRPKDGQETQGRARETQGRARRPQGRARETPGTARKSPGTARRSMDGQGPGDQEPGDQEPGYRVQGARAREQGCGDRAASPGRRRRAELIIIHDLIIPVLNAPGNMLEVPHNAPVDVQTLLKVCPPFEECVQLFKALRAPLGRSEAFWHIYRALLTSFAYLPFIKLNT